MNLRVALVFSGASLASACNHSPAGHAVSSAEVRPGWQQTEQAGRTRREACASGAAEAEDIRLLQTMTVVATEPVYAPDHSDLGKASDRISGTKIIFRQPDGVSARRMTHILRCHSIRALLGVVDALPDDPFSIPGTWVGIKVRREEGNYAAVLEADDATHNLELVARAKAFAKAKSARTAMAPSP